MHGRDLIAPSPILEPSPSGANTPARAARARICLVTSEFHGLFKNGGIGTANTGLALELAAEGHDVVVAFVDPPSAAQLRKSSDYIAHQKRYARLGVTLDVVPLHPRLAIGADDLGWSYSVLAYLQAERFETVFFNECGGQGYFSLAAKHAGQFPDPPRMFVVTHGPGDWVHELNAQLFSGVRMIAMSFLERRSIALADALISPSRYLVGWMRQQGWALPRQVHVIQNILPPSAGTTPPPPDAPIAELVFFGRLEMRKGLALFCDAISRLAEIRDLSRVAVTFMGKFARINAIHSGVYVLERSSEWGTHPRIIANFDQSQALEYLAKPGTLAIMPSLAENSPCVVAECLLAGIPFLATDAGGAPELVALEDRDRCLFDPSPEALCAKLVEALDRGQRPGRMAVPQAETKAQYRRFVAEAPPPPAPSAIEAEMTAAPRVSICVAVESPAEPRDYFLDALLSQTYDDFEILVVAHGAAAPAGLPRPRGAAASGRVRRLEFAAASRAEARNMAAARATGEFLLFIDVNDVIPRPDCVAEFVRIATRRRADIVTGVPLEFRRARGVPIEGWDGEFAYFPVGASKELAIFENCLGRSVFLISRSRFESLGAFEIGVGPAVEDRVLLTRALLAGAAIEVAPCPLYWLRVGETRPSEKPEDQRRIFDLFDGEKIATVARALEGMLASGAHGRDRAMAELSGLDGVAKDLALRMSFAATPTGVETFKPFVEYCLRRGRYPEALEFARFADPVGLLPMAEAAARAATEKSAERAIREVRGPATFPIWLTADVGERIRAVSPLRKEDIRGGADIVASVALLEGVTILKAPAVCPPSTRFVEVVVEADASAGAAVEFMIVVCAPFARVSFVGENPRASDDAFWSGWTRVPRRGAPTKARVELPRTSDCLDLFLISRVAGDAPDGARITWRSVRAEVSVVDLETPSVALVDEAAATLPLHVLARGELLTDAPDFPYPVFLPGKPTLHHPLAGRAAIVRIREAIFPGAAGVRAVFSVDHDGARPVEFGYWARRSSELADDVESLADSLAFSGWAAVRTPFRSHQSRLTLPAPAAETLDLYLATRVVEFPDVNYCHAMWHDISVIEPLVVADFGANPPDP